MYNNNIRQFKSVRRMRWFKVEGQAYLTYSLRDAQSEHDEETKVKNKYSRKTDHASKV